MMRTFLNKQEILTSSVILRGHLYLKGMALERASVCQLRRSTTVNKRSQRSQKSPDNEKEIVRASKSLSNLLEKDVVFKHSQACLRAEGRSNQIEAVIWSPHTQYPAILLRPGQRSIYEHIDDIPSHVQPLHWWNSMQQRSFFASQRNYNRRILKYLLTVIVVAMAVAMGLCAEIYVHQPRELLVLREEILGHAYGKVLELGAGQGASIGLYPYPAHEIWMIDKNLSLLKRLVQRIPINSYPSYHILHKHVEDLNSVPDNSFDTVVDCFGLCHYHNPIKTLREMQRICKKDGIVLLLEHGKSKNDLLNYLLGIYRSKNSHGCIRDRDIESVIMSSGLKVKEIRRKHFGTTTFCVGYPRS
uniref:Methyltransferase type 11 domain-containing protein n=1 Tax=Paramoeba aestuarina TaxID=180227 RepID=A0A7S4L942_9EUKA|mmetsp:Transcript_33705/g.52703  ORF Transcript_33705/g.52703 Transcript_33705/m.52703 type:complete len:359 (+) Transcript_33705:14-1090(+)